MLIVSPAHIVHHVILHRIASLSDARFFFFFLTCTCTCRSAFARHGWDGCPFGGVCFAHADVVCVCLFFCFFLEKREN